MCPPNGFYTYDEATGELIDFRIWAISDYMRDVRPPPEGTGPPGRDTFAHGLCRPAAIATRRRDV